jgi:hypothetical protein
MYIFVYEDDDDFCLFLQKQKLAQRYVPIRYSLVVIKKARVMMLVSCSLWRHDVSFSLSVDVIT